VETTRRRRIRRALLIAAALGLLYCLRLAVGPRGDISYRNSCWGPTLYGYVNPMPTGPDQGDFAFLSSLCNADAVHKMHQLFALLPVSTALLLTALHLRPRGHPDPATRDDGSARGGGGCRC
jgi:hypothetical protein